MRPESGSLNLDETLRSAQAGSVQAFNTLVVEYQRQIFNVCYRTLGNSEEAADTTQDALLSAFRAIKTFKGPAVGLRGWLLRIALNACYDQLRRRQRHPTDSLDELSPGGSDADTSAAEHVTDPNPGPEQNSLTAETARTIQAAIDRLAPDQRTAVVLCDVQGLSYEEAAQAMGVELGTVKSRLSRARAHLRDVLTVKGELRSPPRRLEERNP